MLRRLHHREEGMALIVAILVTFVVLLLSTMVVAQSFSASDEGAFARKRVQSQGGAEAGINYFYEYLENTDIDTLSCDPVTQTVDTAPGTSSFTATPYFYDAAGADMDCSIPFDQDYFPAAALIRSTGSTNGGVERTMETYMELTPDYGGFGSAIITNGAGGLTLGNNLTVNGDGSQNADIYVNNGPLTLSNQPTVNGSVYVGGGCVPATPCTATLSNSTNIKRNLWVNGTAYINSPSTVTGNVTSSTGDVTKGVGAGGSILGNATAAGIISPALTVGGNQSPGTTSAAPPTKPFPTITWNAADWVAEGYTVTEFATCPAARTAILSGLLGKNVVRINAVCDLLFQNNDTIPVNNDLAIFTDGSISMQNFATWNGASAGAPHDLFFIDTYRSPLDCSGGAYDISDSQNVQYVNVEVFYYSPCTVAISNRSTVSGQIFGTTVTMANNMTLNYKPVLVPGVGTIEGFTQDIVYIREVVS